MLLSNIFLTDTIYLQSKYASSGTPVVVTNATDDWPAREEFDLEFFHILYQVRQKIEKILIL